MTPALIRKYALPVPRYTSYPTAPQFSPAVSAATYDQWLAKLPSRTDLSLYVHIPFCHILCWYCGCTTKATRRHEPVADYMRSLVNEISFVSRHLRSGQTVRQLHWGGGSPNILSCNEILRLSDAIRAYFNVASDAEFSVEVDPRTHSKDKTEALVAAGLTRLSIGVQDFDADVQASINRIQSFETTRSVINGFRRLGIASINIDLVYGLPKQTTSKAMATLDKVLQLHPDRIALFGYAHLPQRIAHQRMIHDADLPNSMERFEQSTLLASKLLAAGYVRVGLDHFALPNDPLANGPRHRNFQGYTNDDCDVLIGLGASSIGKLPDGYVQNTVSTPDYKRRVRDDGLATYRGHALDDDDRMRAYAIERIMCDLRFPADELVSRFGPSAESLIKLAAELIDNDRDGLVEPELKWPGFAVTELGRPFVRTIAAHFDAYLERTGTQYSTGV